MNTALDELCSEYSDAELATFAEFLRRVSGAGRDATDELAVH